jgi:2-hydroxy-3-oxopropionate reductase
MSEAGLEKVGFIGLGLMGRPMAKNLVKAGFAVTGFETMPENAQKAAEAGVKIAGSIAELAKHCPVIINMLPTPAICKNVSLGNGGIAENAGADTLVVEMSSISATTAKEIHQGLVAKGVHMLDAPVSGSDLKAIDGTLSIMVGGAKDDCERAMPMFKAMSASVIRVGEIGAGSIAKLANQIMVGANIAGMGEAFTLAAKAGVDPGLVFEAVRGGLAGSTVLEIKGPKVLARDYEPGARMEIHIKDYTNVLETAHSMNVPVPLTALVMEMMQSLKANGLGNIDHGSVVRFYELIAGVEVKQW